jgi:hypothetical protein
LEVDVLPTPWHLNQNVQVKGVSHSIVEHSDLQNGTQLLALIYSPLGITT